MGFTIDPTPQTGEYSVEIRDESFYLRGEHTFDAKSAAHVERRHAINVYENGATGQGTIEILLEDLPKIRACLDLVEEALQKRK
jgi:predicted transport protein